MILAGIAVAALLDPITYSCRATAIPIVLAELSKATGVKLRAKDEAKSEIVFLHVDGLPLESLMRKIAFVTSCQWDKSGDGYTLAPAATMRRQEESAEAAAKAAGLDKSLQDQFAEIETERKKSLDPPKPGSPPEDPDEGAGYDPGNLVALKFATQLGIPTLASLPEGHKYVWATNNPTEAQRSFSEDCGELVAEWTAETNRIAKALSDQVSSAQYETTDQREAAKAFIGSHLPITAPIAKVLFEVKPSRGGLSLRVKAFDGKGQVVEEGAGNLFPARTPPQTPKKGATPGLAPLELSPDSEALSGALQGFLRSGHRVDPPLDEMRRLFDLAQVDPLSLGPSDIVDCYRRNGHPQIVADLPDALERNALSILRNPDMAAGAQRSIDAIDGGLVVKVSEEDSVTLLRPAVPTANRATRINRAAFAALLAAVIAHGCPTLDEQSAYAVDNPAPGTNPVALVYRILAPTLINMPLSPGAWSVLRFYGTLDDEQKRALLSGTGLDLSSLSSAQREAAEDYLYTDAALEEMPDGVPPQHTADNADWIATRGLPSYLGLEPTEILATGLRGGFLSCSVATTPAAMVDPLEEDFGGVMMVAEDYGQFLAMAKGVQDSDSGMAAPKKAKMGEAIQLSLIFHVTRSLGAQAQLTDLRIPNGPFVPVAELPADFLAKASEAEKLAASKSSAASGTEKQEAVPF